MLVMLRDGRKLIGVLRSYDQFGVYLFALVVNVSPSISQTHIYSSFPPNLANLVLEATVERIYHGSTFAERKVGVFLIRGENVVLLGEVVSTLWNVHGRCLE